MRINGNVHLRTVLLADSMVPIGWVAVGDPVRILPPEDHDGIWAVQKNLDFPGYVFGLDRPADGESLMSAISERFGRGLGRSPSTSSPILLAYFVPGGAHPLDRIRISQLGRASPSPREWISQQDRHQPQKTSFPYDASGGLCRPSGPDAYGCHGGSTYLPGRGRSAKAD